MRCSTAATAALVIVLLQPLGTARLAAFQPTRPQPSPAVPAVTTSVNGGAQQLMIRMAIETPLPGTTVPSTFLIAGYAFDSDAVSGSGVDGVAVYAYRNFGSGEPGVFLGMATYGMARPDVARAFGDRFTASGFQLTTPELAAGSYRIYTFAHSVQTNAYSAYVFTDVVVASVSALAVEAPAAAATVMPTFAISGWAIDGLAADGPGVDTVHLYLSANDGADAPVFLGVASYGSARNDIAATYGARFLNSGFTFTARGLRPGAYLLTVFARSTATGTFSLAQTRRFTVDATTLMAIDVPSAGGAIDAPAFGIMGWAIDRSSQTGTGVDTLHVYAFREPGSGQPPIFLGVATTGFSRPDVAAIYGSRFDPSGYALVVDRAAAGLTPGVYDIVVWTHSSVCDAFTAVSVARVTLR